MAKETLNVPARSTIWYLVSGISVKAIGILSTPVFTRILSKEEYGSFAFYLTVSGIISGLLLPFFSGSQIYGLIEKYKDQKNSLYLSAALSTFAVFVVICLLLFTFGGFFALSSAVELLLSIGVLCDGLVLLYISFKRYDYSFKAVTFINVCQALLSVSISFILIWVFKLGYLGRIFGLILPSMLFALAILITEIFSKKNRPNFQMSAVHIKMGGSLLPNSALSAFGGQIDRLMTAYLLGQTAIGMYSVAHSLGAGLYFIITALSSALAPWMVRRLKMGDSQRVCSVVSIIAYGISAAAIFLVAVSPEALALLAPIEYSTAVFAVMPIALSVIFAFYSTVAQTVIIHRGRTRFLTLSKLFSLVSGLVSGFIFIPLFGFFGAGLTVFISEGVSAVASSLCLSHIGEPVFTLQDILSVLFPSVILGTVCLLLTDIPSVRILLLIIPSVSMLNTALKAKGYLLEKS